MSKSNGTLSQANEVGNVLDSKGANGPCPRCGNNSFLVLEQPTPMYMVFCDNCGLKFEHFAPILMDPSTSVSSSPKKE